MLIIIRHCFEKTIKNIEKYLEANDLHRSTVFIQEESFHDSLIKIFTNKHFTSMKSILQIDGDIIPTNKSINKMIQYSKKAKPEIKIIQPLVLSKFALDYRYAGVHLYLNDFALEIGNIVQNENFSLKEFYSSDRPETYLKHLALKENYKSKFSRFVFGFEDFNQYPEDIFRKGAMFQRKNPSMVEINSDNWKKLAMKDTDFRVLLQGVDYEKNMNDDKLLYSMHSQNLFKSDTYKRDQINIDFIPRIRRFSISYICRARSFNLSGKAAPDSFWIQNLKLIYNIASRFMFRVV